MRPIDVRCPDCEGRGRRLVATDNPEPDTVLINYCQKCQGSGRIRGWVKSYLVAGDIAHGALSCPECMKEAIIRLDNALFGTYYGSSKYPEQGYTMRVNDVVPAELDGSILCECRYGHRWNRTGMWTQAAKAHYEREIAQMTNPPSAGAEAPESALRGSGMGC